ncbi:FMN-dependent NADH-azoreductase [Hydrogenophaga sp. Root209]|uniref:FMN-dependent NADH-azoreductase n=1 Tax=unclassified Hydrogenophaga TaxID=2610897 RepID=UPI000700AA36|nr:NAD(P)H-dependent oxidoreductase [Hydrogenophaga sp. Root209]KRC12118.1 FMN-dependent NADH-azoreductase [Hydrogenophaga sp. Root209]
MNILHIDASAQTIERSITRQLGQVFLQELLRAAPDTQITYRDLAINPVAPVDSEWIAAAFTRPSDRTTAMQERLALSDRLIAELEAADLIVVGVPMYNYGAPGALKCWIDQTARIGKTFSFDLARGDVPIQGILSGKSLVVLSARGEFGFGAGGMREKMNTLDPLLAACAHYWGVARDEIHNVIVEYQEFKDERFATSLVNAHERAKTLARDLASIETARA